MRRWPFFLVAALVTVVVAVMGPLYLWNAFGPRPEWHGWDGREVNERAQRLNPQQAEAHWQKELAQARTKHDEGYMTTCLGHVLALQILRHEPCQATMSELAGTEKNFPTEVANDWVLGFNSALQVSDLKLASTLSDNAIRAARARTDAGPTLGQRVQADGVADRQEERVDRAMGKACLDVHDPGLGLGYLERAFDLVRHLPRRPRQDYDDNNRDQDDPADSLDSVQALYVTALRELGRDDEAKAVAHMKRPVLTGYMPPRRRPVQAAPPSQPASDAPPPPTPENDASCCCDAGR